MILAAAAFQLLSSTFKPNASMPIATVATGCGGKNVSPELHWSGAPARTKSFALIVHDPDAPRPGGYYHWVVATIPASAVALGAGTDLYPGYDGPCPPPGNVHHYHITLYALDVAHLRTALPTNKQDRARAVEAATKGHVLGTAVLTGLYQTTGEAH